MKNAPNLKSSRRISWRSQLSLPALMRTFAKAWQEMNPIGDTVPPVVLDKSSWRSWRISELWMMAGSMPGFAVAGI